MQLFMKNYGFVIYIAFKICLADFELSHFPALLEIDA